MGIAVSKSEILVVGVAYKKDVGDYRESPVLDILRLLKKEGANVIYHDPYVPVLSERDLAMTSRVLTSEEISASDLVIIATDHSNIDYESLVFHSKKILDTRNATRNVKNHREKITLL